MLRLGLFLHKCRHGTRVVYEFAMRAPLGTLLVVDNVGADVFEELSIVGDNKDGL